MAVPADPTPDADQYLRVARRRAAIEPGELDVYTSAPARGVGYRVIVPLALADGRRILLDRGFVPIGEKDAPRRLGPIAVEGSLAWPQETDRFTSPPDRAKNIWFARDVPLMAEALGTAAGDAGRRRRATTRRRRCRCRSTVNIPNDHLQYAITWFAAGGGLGADDRLPALAYQAPDRLKD